MSDVIDSPPPPPPPPPTPDSPDRPVCTAAEIASGKAMAIIGYALNFVHIPFFLVPLIMRSDRLSLYHAKQCLILWLAALGVLTAMGLIVIATVGLGVCVVVPAYAALWVAGVVINIMGMVNAINGKCTPMPIIGDYGERWFAGIKVEHKGGATA